MHRATRCTSLYFTLNSWQQRKKHNRLKLSPRICLSFICSYKPFRAVPKLQSIRRVRTSYCLFLSFTFPSPLRCQYLFKSSWSSSAAGENPAFRCEAKWPLTLHGGCRSAEWKQRTNAEQRLSERIPPVKHRLSCSSPSLLTNTHTLHRRAPICKVVKTYS